MLQPLSLPFWGDAVEMAYRNRKAGKRGVGKITTGWDPRLETGELESLYKPFVEGESILKFTIDMPPQQAEEFELKSGQSAYRSSQRTDSL